VGPAEGGEEVVQGRAIGDVDRGQLQTPLVSITVKQIVVTDCNIKEMARRDTRRILVVVLSPGRRYLDQGRAVLGSRT
jgi:hypothetical protein